MIPVISENSLSGCFETTRTTCSLTHSVFARAQSEPGDDWGLRLFDLTHGLPPRLWAAVTTRELKSLVLNCRSQGNIELSSVYRVISTARQSYGVEGLREIADAKLLTIRRYLAPRRIVRSCMNKYM